MGTDKEAVSRIPASVFSHELEFDMREELDIINITSEVAQVLHDSGLKDGIASLFVPGATGVLTCLEYEPGVIADFQAAIERLAPRDLDYEHNRYQSDGNGHSHVRAGLLGPSMTIPFIQGELTLGVWQQLVLINCDNRARKRRLIVQIMGS